MCACHHYLEEIEKFFAPNRSFLAIWLPSRLYLSDRSSVIDLIPRPLAESDCRCQDPTDNCKAPSFGPEATVPTAYASAYCYNRNAANCRTCCTQFFACKSYTFTAKYEPTPCDVLRKGLPSGYTRLPYMTDKGAYAVPDKNFFIILRDMAFVKGCLTAVGVNATLARNQVMALASFYKVSLYVQIVLETTSRMFFSRLLRLLKSCGAWNYWS